MGLYQVTQPDPTLQETGESQNSNNQPVQTRPFSYLFTISYFGARYKGWAIQKGQATIQGKIERVIRFVLGHEDFTVMGGSRTDSGVSCKQGFFQIFLKEEVDWIQLIPALNENLGGEIFIHEVKPVERSFNLIQQVQRKTYRYYFTENENHAFASSFVVPVFKDLRLEQMELAAKAFEGSHDFKAFCTPSATKSDFIRKINSCEIRVDQGVLAKEFLQDEIYCFEVEGEGFLHHQVRKMMRAIWYVGSGEWKLEEIHNRLSNPDSDWQKIPAAPAYGLFLWETHLKNPSDF